MSRESDLLFGVLALQLNLVSKTEFLQCVDAWAKDPARTPRAQLDERGLLTGAKRNALDGMVAAMVEANAGDEEATLRMAPVDADVYDTIRTIVASTDVKDALSAAAPRAGGGVTLASPARDRYRLGAQVASGGLGRIVEAWDSSLDRDVAVKILLDESAPGFAERFVREAKLAGRLEHPNIVPVYDFGILPQDGRMFLTMKRVRGRDLRLVLRAIAAGDAESRREFTRTRLLQVFQDVCEGMAFAHHRGVIHRDLKPANVMLGDFGEVHIVDWGLARVVGSLDDGARPPAAPGASASGSSGPLTAEGEILGTFAYMSPEQAEGRRADLDARSDIYALGAILYEILALRPAFEGAPRDILARVRAGGLPPPSSRAGGADAVPAELDAICLKAMAFRKEDRFASAVELRREVQAFLEGTRALERERKLADEAVARAREALARRDAVASEAKLADAAAARAEAETEASAPDKRAMWAAQDRARALGNAVVEALAEADGALTSALTHARDHRDARRLKAELAWEAFLAAEEKEDERGMLLHRRMVERFNDGHFDALLRGEGTLSVSARAMPCRCLSDGRGVEPGELTAAGYHLFSGRLLGGRPGSEGRAELEPDRPLRIRVHGRDCSFEAVDGADVWLYRFEEIDRRLLPVTPTGSPAGAFSPPPRLLEALWPEPSPFRPRGTGLHLGRTPLARRALPMGSWLLVVAREGRVPARVPVFVPRCGHVEAIVTLLRPDEVPAGVSHVADGDFISQGDARNPFSSPAERHRLADFFLARDPVTCREYLRFLESLDPATARRRAPREAADVPSWWNGPPFSLAGARRLPNASVDWDENWPVFGVSWDDAMAYCDWKRRTDGFLWTLPHELQWEKAARGPDRRPFPWGRHFEHTWACSNRSHPDGARPARVDDFPSDESPYGIRGLAGNSRDVCLNIPAPEFPDWRISRGGFWTDTGIRCRATDRTGHPPSRTNWYFGFRPAVAFRLDADAR